MIASVIPRVTTMANGSFNNFTKDDSLSLTAELEGEWSSKTQGDSLSLTELARKLPELPASRETRGDSLSLTELDGELPELAASRETQDRTIPAVSAVDFDELEEPGQRAPPMELQLPAPTDDPIPRCLTILERLKREHGLDDLFVVNMGDEGIAVFGENVESIQPQILNALRNLGIPNIRVNNKINTPTTVGYFKLLSCRVMKKVIISKEWKLDGTVFCEIIIRDRGDNAATYAVIPAHLFLTIEQSRHLASVDGDNSHTRDQVTKQGKECEYMYMFKNENHDESVILNPPPLLAYRHWESGLAIDTTDSMMQKEETKHKKSTVFMNDIALMRFESYKPDKLAEKSEVFPIPTKQHLDVLARRKQRVIIGSYEGMVIRSPEGVGNMNHNYGLHLSFIITSQDPDGKISKLDSGSSGLVVFFKGKQGQLIPVGMLVSKLSVDIKIHGSSIYQAIVLSQALKEIEQDYPQQISHIHVLETCHQSKGANMVTNQRKMEPAIQGDSGSQDIAAVTQTDVKSDVANNKPPKDSTVELIKPSPATTLHTEVRKGPLVISKEQSHQGSDVELSDLKPNQNKMEGIWYRHSGQLAVYCIPSHWGCTFKTFEDDTEILEDIGTHHITHMYVREGDVPSLNFVAPGLKKLRIEGSHGDQTTSALRSLQSLKELKELEIYGVDLSDGLPPGISHSTSLEMLELRHCRLTDLPESMSSLSNLKYLDLEDNDFSKGLPQVFGELTSLETLNLEHCKLTNLPTSMSSLSNLEHLYLDDNDFSKGLPEVFTQLTSLETLDLRHCKLTNLPTSMSSLCNLKRFRLLRNDFSKGLPEVITQMTSLQILDIGECNLTNLPASFGKLTKLDCLFLDDNSFKSLPPVICELKNLDYLSLGSSNQLESLHPGILHLSKLCTLLVYGCPSLTTPPQKVSEQGLEAIKQYYKDLEK